MRVGDGDAEAGEVGEGGVIGVNVVTRPKSVGDWADNEERDDKGRVAVGVVDDVALIDGVEGGI